MNDVKNVELEPDSEPAFEKRQVEIKNNRWITDDFEVLEFLGRSVRQTCAYSTYKIDQNKFPKSFYLQGKIR